MKITKTWARKALKAVNKVILLYKEGVEANGKDCPFCVEFIEGAECPRCPWRVFKKTRCTLWGYYNTPIYKRLPRLYGWRKRLTNIIERGK